MPFSLSGSVAGIGEVPVAWFNRRISPGNLKSMRTIQSHDLIDLPGALHFSPNGLLGFTPRFGKSTKETNMRNIAYRRFRSRPFITISSSKMAALARKANRAPKHVKIDPITPFEGLLGRLENPVL